MDQVARKSEGQNCTPWARKVWPSDGAHTCCDDSEELEASEGVGSAPDGMKKFSDRDVIPATLVKPGGPWLLGVADLAPSETSFTAKVDDTIRENTSSNQRLGAWSAKCSTFPFSC